MKFFPLKKLDVPEIIERTVCLYPITPKVLFLLTADSSNSAKDHGARFLSLVRPAFYIQVHLGNRLSAVRKHASKGGEYLLGEGRAVPERAELRSAWTRQAGEFIRFR